VQSGAALESEGTLTEIKGLSRAHDAHGWAISHRNSTPCSCALNGNVHAVFLFILSLFGCMCYDYGTWRSSSEYIIGIMWTNLGCYAGHCLCLLYCACDVEVLMIDSVLSVRAHKSRDTVRCMITHPSQQQYLCSHATSWLHMFEASPLPIGIATCTLSVGRMSSLFFARIVLCRGGQCDAARNGFVPRLRISRPKQQDFSNGGECDADYTVNKSRLKPVLA